jgi:hypothetical protein
MTTLEAIKSTVAGYPLAEGIFQKVLIDRGLTATAEYTGKSKQFELATADVYTVLVTAANINEGGYQVSVTDKSNFMKMASAIYQKWGDSAGSSPTINDASSLW